MTGENVYCNLENNLASYCSGMSNCRSQEEELNGFGYKWKPEIAWLGKAIEPALQLYKWALPTGNKPPRADRSLVEIISGIQRSKLGIPDWALSDLTIGLCLMYLRKASANDVEEVKGSGSSIPH